MNRRSILNIMGIAISSLLISACGSSGEMIEVKNVAHLKKLRGITHGRQVRLLGHSIDGIGGGIFQADLFDRKSKDDGGSVIVGLNGVRFKRIRPEIPSAEMFGASVNLEEDQSAYINNCMKAYGACYLNGGKIYNIKYPIGAIVLGTYGSGTAALNLVSPTNDNRFGYSPFVDSAAVFCDGKIGTPLSGVHIENIEIFCNGLLNANGTTGVKGFILMRCVNFFQRNCFVYDSSSYAFWDADASRHKLEILTYCSGVRENCTAVDSHVGFEQVNCRGVTLINCNAVRTNKILSYTVEALFHAYGGADMQLIYRNCSAVADGQCTATLLFARECKNVLIDNCLFVNNYNNGDNIQASVFFEGKGANYDNIIFKNSVFRSMFSHSIVLNNGEFGSNSANFQLINCTAEGYHVGIQINGIGGIYYLENCHVIANATGDTVPWAIYVNGVPSGLNMKGGSATVLGEIVAGLSNMEGIFEDVLLSPANLH